MRKDHSIEEGHVFSEEDRIYNMRWEILELIKDKKSTEIILDWEDSDLWRKYSKDFIK